MVYIAVDSIPTSIENNSLFNINPKSVTHYTHGFHKYPGKFIPQIPSWAINKYLNPKSPGTVFDPFCGSGTTLVESLVRGHNAIGTDIDPLSVLISKVKSTPVNVDDLQRVKEWVLKEIETDGKPEFIPECDNILHWFSEEAIEKLSIIRTAIDKIQEEFKITSGIKDIQELFLICFSSIIRRVSKADNQSQKTYVSGTRIKTPDEVFGVFKKQIALYQKRISLFSDTIKENLTSHVYCASSTNGLNEKLAEHTIDLAISSPPYIKAIDYVYNQMVELFWIGDLFNMQTQEKQNIKKTAYIGTKAFKKVQYSDYNPATTFFDIPTLDNKLQEVFTQDQKNGHKHAFITYQYFQQMENHFQNISEILKDGQHYIVVIGDSGVSNINFQTSDFLVNLAERNGFKLLGKWGYKIKNRYMNFNRKGRGGIIETDWVLDFRKE